ncbi:hypothetical protein HCUR_00948 [Holospora curviuscula]|uniref:Uncharacterized protein n=1 Tax=Holospora curviuscula TaxID=1082868 RepID=A0A2S5R8H9_9PROT|nr:hypothetical protein HCUR_00948 [Holospora curviuscula]
MIKSSVSTGWIRYKKEKVIKPQVRLGRKEKIDPNQLKI